MCNSKKKILLVEDEFHIAEGLRFNLDLKGYEVNIAKDGLVGLEMWRKWKPDLIVLDLMLPAMDGFDLLEHIRKEDERLPIIILSAKLEAKDKVRCFSKGVDDYMSKPFDLNEFLLRIERLLKRSSWGDGQKEIVGESEAIEKIVFGSNRVDFTKNEAFNGSEAINLTTQEIKLLKLFITNEGVPLSRQYLLETGWGYQGEISTRTVDNFIVRFRKYFEKDPKNPIYFRSLRAVGYVFNR
ncbi:MAG: response regulator transcription factor [Bacteriovoracaceae bacterium]|nr:response regulator transcription factor [Bacteriovoracaceae bacterium]